MFNHRYFAIIQPTAIKESKKNHKKIQPHTILPPGITSNKLNKISKNVNKNKYYKKNKKAKKTKTGISSMLFTFYRIFFRILFLLEEASKIKSVYGKQDYQPGAKIKGLKQLKIAKK